MKKKCIMGLSGGMDSATLCGYYLSKGVEVLPVLFNYGSKHFEQEKKSSYSICHYYGLSPIEIPLLFINEFFKSNLLKNGGKIPEGHYQQENMKLTVVPGRNLIFLSILCGLADSKGAEIIALGVHSGDHEIYPDCRAGFVSSINSSIIQATEDRVRVEAPFQYLNKTEILKIGYSLNPIVPYNLTRTCYTEGELSCGRCGSCSERLEAFQNINRKDPIKYTIN